jgi:hypothetical protein
MSLSYLFTTGDTGILFNLLTIAMAAPEFLFNRLNECRTNIDKCVQEFNNLNKDKVKVLHNNNLEFAKGALDLCVSRVNAINCIQEYGEDIIDISELEYDRKCYEIFKNNKIANKNDRCDIQKLHFNAEHIHNIYARLCINQESPMTYLRMINESVIQNVQQYCAIKSFVLYTKLNSRQMLSLLCVMHYSNIVQDSIKKLNGTEEDFTGWSNWLLSTIRRIVMSAYGKLDKKLYIKMIQDIHNLDIERWTKEKGKKDKRKRKKKVWKLWKPLSKVWKPFKFAIVPPNDDSEDNDEEEIEKMVQLPKLLLNPNVEEVIEIRSKLSRISSIQQVNDEMNSAIKNYNSDAEDDISDVEYHDYLYQDCIIEEQVRDQGFNTWSTDWRNTKASVGVIQNKFMEHTSCSDEEWEDLEQHITCNFSTLSGRSSEWYHENRA